MPWKTTVGLCRKIGQPNYGSLGATCHVEFKLSAALIQYDLAAFHQQVRDVFAACSQAVDEELARQREPSVTEKTVLEQPPSNGHGQLPPNGSPGTSTPAPGASEKQLSYLQQLARQTPGVGLQTLEDLAQHLCGTPVVGVSSTEASRLIDTLKAVKSGEMHLHDLLTGAAL